MKESPTSAVIPIATETITMESGNINLINASTNSVYIFYGNSDSGITTGTFVIKNGVKLTLQNTVRLDQPFAVQNEHTNINFNLYGQEMTIDEFNAFVGTGFWSSDSLNPNPSAGGASKETHTHNFVWVTVKDPTVTEDGEEDYLCSCGEIQTRIVIPANMYYVKELNRQIMEAPENGEVTFEAGWNSDISDYVIKKLIGRPDVTVTINFTYEKKAYSLVLPAGTDYAALLEDEFQIYGYFGFAKLLGLEVTAVE